MDVEELIAEIMSTLELTIVFVAVLCIVLACIEYNWNKLVDAWAYACI